MGNAMEALHVRVSADLKRTITARAVGQHRSPSDQARRYLEIAIAAEANPDLPFAMIAQLVESKAEADAGLLEPVDWSVE